LAVSYPGSVEWWPWAPWCVISPCFHVPK
jgi:hypothetical protein